MRGRWLEKGEWRHCRCRVGEWLVLVWRAFGLWIFLTRWHRTASPPSSQTYNAWSHVAHSNHTKQLLQISYTATGCSLAALHTALNHPTASRCPSPLLLLPPPPLCLLLLPLPHLVHQPCIPHCTPLLPDQRQRSTATPPKLSLQHSKDAGALHRPCRACGVDPMRVVCPV